MISLTIYVKSTTCRWLHYYLTSLLQPTCSAIQKVTFFFMEYYSHIALPCREVNVYSGWRVWHFSLLFLSQSCVALWSPRFYKDAATINARTNLRGTPKILGPLRKVASLLPEGLILLGWLTARWCRLEDLSYGKRSLSHCPDLPNFPQATQLAVAFTYAISPFSHLCCQEFSVSADRCLESGQNPERMDHERTSGLPQVSLCASLPLLSHSLTFISIFIPSYSR